jgi:hypothetical protein
VELSQLHFQQLHLLGILFQLKIMVVLGKQIILHYVITEVKLMVLVQQVLLKTEDQSVTLIYVDATKGWQDIQDSTAGISGGFIYNVEYLVVAGGGGGAGPSCYGGGGGGAGGFRTAACFPVSSASGPYTVTVGAGGNGVGPGATTITKGSDSVFSSITSAGGGGGSWSKVLLVQFVIIVEVQVEEQEVVHLFLQEIQEV